MPADPMQHRDESYPGKSALTVPGIRQVRFFAMTIAALFCIVTLPLLLSTTANARIAERFCWDKAELQQWSQIQIGDCVEFAGDLLTTFCREIAMEGRPLGYFAKLVAAGERLLARECREYDMDLPEETEFLRYGGSSLEYSEIRPPTSGNDQWSIADFPIPDFGFYSNPMFCGARVAYWRFHERNIGVRVFDVDRRAMVHSQEVGTVRIGNDNPGALVAPIWSADCSHVRFDTHRGVPAVDITF